MPSLVDIGNLSVKVDIRGTQLEVFGVSAEGLVDLLVAFPELRRYAFDQGDAPKTEDLVRTLPKAVAAIIAAGTGHPGEEAHIDVASKLGAGEQAELIREIWKLTFPRGAASFIAALEGLTADVVVASGKGPVTKSPEPSSS